MSKTHSIRNVINTAREELDQLEAGAYPRGWYIVDATGCRVAQRKVPEGIQYGYEVRSDLELTHFEPRDEELAKLICKRFRKLTGQAVNVINATDWAAHRMQTLRDLIDSAEKLLAA